MKIAVIGAGAMGSIYASFLAQSNNDVLRLSTKPTEYMRLG